MAYASMKYIFLSYTGNLTFVSGYTTGVIKEQYWRYQTFNPIQPSWYRMADKWDIVECDWTIIL